MYVREEAEKGSLGGREDGSWSSLGWVEGCVEGEGDGVACGSLRRRMTWVIVGWKMPPNLECAMRCMGRVFP